MSIATYGRSFSAWREAAANSWDVYVQHEFVEGLKTGTLDRKHYLHYMVQDYVYLVHYSRAWALGVVKAETLDEMKFCASVVDALTNQEMELHIKTCKAVGIDGQALFSAVEMPQNIAYTRYLMDAGLSGDYLDLMAALAPCTFGYGEIGLNLAKHNHADHAYKDWIDCYASDDYQGLCAAMGDMLDRSILERLGDKPEKNPRWQKLQARFDRASLLEADFWQMGLDGAYVPNLQEAIAE